MRADRSVRVRLASLSRRRAAPNAPLVRAFLARAGEWKLLGRRGTATDLAAHLSAAGWDLTPQDFRAVQVLVMGGAVVVCVAAAFLIPMAAALVPLMALVASRGPRMALARAARRRRKLADREVPQFLDILAAASTAGLGPHAALGRAVGATTGPLERELRRFLAEVELGARWRDGLVRMTERLQLPDLRRAVQAMVRTERLGSSLADALRELADEVRDERRQSAAERARKAPVKMLFPLVFMILPAFLLLTVVPVLISTLRSIR
jgi:tight adherence protein C